MDIDNERLAALENAFDEMGPSSIRSAEELMRSEEIRAARMFSLSLPKLRTSVRLRFHGKGVQGHNLPGDSGGTLIRAFSEAAKAMAAQLGLPATAGTLFISPTVLPGSAILELFSEESSGVPVDADGEPVDTDSDVVIGNLFDALEAANDKSASTADTFTLDPKLGVPLFELSRNLIDSEIDMDVEWSKARGAVKSIALDRKRARLIRDHLDRDVEKSITVTEEGTLTDVSVEGWLTLKVGTRRYRIKTSTVSRETLRSLWAKPVLAKWRETTHHHPSRGTSRTTRKLLSVTPAPGAPSLDE